MTIKKRFWITLVLDFVIITIIFMICQAIMSAPSGLFWYGAIFIWCFIGIVSQKFRFELFKRTWHAFIIFIVINIVSLGILYLFAIRLGLNLFFSWKYILLIGVLTILELILYRSYVYFIRKAQPFELESVELDPYHSEAKIKLEDYIETISPRIEAIFNALKHNSAKDPLAWCNSHKHDLGEDIKVFANTDILSIMENYTRPYNFLCDASRLNNVRFINKYFEKINALLPFGGVFIACCETSITRKKRLLSSLFFPFNYILYTFDFLWHRVGPKLQPFRRLYFFMTKGRHRVFPFSEILGRLYSCGFEIVREEYIHGFCFFAVVKTNTPYDILKASYGPIIQLKRVGKDGKLFAVYKLRTMHAYSEYLQPYIYQKNKLKEGGKFADDFRISSWGRFLRKYWLDELPMIINMIKGEIKLVGVRPLSPHYFSLYTPEMQALHIKVKPGLLPPFYTDMPETIEEVQESERKYIEAYLAHPFKTDWKYFWKIVYMILFRRKRSA